MRKIAVLTSGGDAPGMNAAIRAAVRTALYNGLEVVGVRRGFAGLIEGDFFLMETGSVSDIMQKVVLSCFQPVVMNSWSQKAEKGC